MTEEREPYWKSIESRKEAILASDRERESKEMEQFSSSDPAKVVKQDMLKFKGAIGVAVASGIGAIISCILGHWWIALAALIIFGGGGFLYGSSVLRHRTKVVKYSMVRDVVTSYFSPEVYLAAYLTKA